MFTTILVLAVLGGLAYVGYKRLVKPEPEADE